MTLDPEARALVEQAKTRLAEATKNQASARARIDYANCRTDSYRARCTMLSADGRVTEGVVVFSTREAAT